jgi:DHA1 family bicyclomycin/chloramphenicol resistance-like MFS transporter
MVIPRAVVRDLHTGTEAARLMSLLMLVFSVSPILAPLVGSFVIEAAGWRGVFWVVTVLAALGILLLAFCLGETRPRADRVESSIAGALAAYRSLLTDRQFLGLTFIGAFGIASFFAYLANSSFVLIEHYGLTPRLYSVFFSINGSRSPATPPPWWCCWPSPWLGSTSWPCWPRCCSSATASSAWSSRPPRCWRWRSTAPSPAPPRP